MFVLVILDFLRFFHVSLFSGKLRCTQIKYLLFRVIKWRFQKQLSGGVLRKRCSDILQQIYRRTSIPKCDFNKVALNLLKSHFGMGVPP